MNIRSRIPSGVTNTEDPHWTRTGRRNNETGRGNERHERGESTGEGLNRLCPELQKGGKRKKRAKEKKGGKKRGQKKKKGQKSKFICTYAKFFVPLQPQLEKHKI